MSDKSKEEGMKPKQIVVFPRGQCSDRDRKAMQRAGIIVVEADDPSKVVTVLPLVSGIAPDDILGAAMNALSDKSYVSSLERFGKFVAERVLAKEPHNAK